MTNNETEHKRDTYWDTVKAILIFLVIVGHVVQFMQYHNGNFWNDPLFKGIYLFHMPLFMLISGYFAAKSIKKRGNEQAIKSYLRRLALPCIGMGIIYLAFALMEKKSLWFICSGCISLWFLIVLFECLVCYYIMQKKQEWWYKIATFILPIPAAIACGNHPCIQLLWPHTYQFTYLWPIFMIGAIMAKTGFSHQRINWKWCTFPILYITLFFLFQPSWYVYRWPLSFSFDSLLVDIFRTFAAIVGCGTALWITKFLYIHLSKITLIQNIGKATLGIYVLQTLFFIKVDDIYSSESMGHVEVIIASLGILGGVYFIYTLTCKIPIISVLLYGERKR